jgi:hypothetical protein
MDGAVGRAVENEHKEMQQNFGLSSELVELLCDVSHTKYTKSSHLS